MSEPSTSPPDDDASAWPASLRFEHGVFESRYQVLRSLSDGGMGEVVLAEHLKLGKKVAIKIMHPQYRGDAATEARFILETRAAARIHHDNVVGISDFGRTADGRMFFVMEYLEGEDLAQTLRREGPLPWKRVVHITRHVVRAIGEVHRKGVIHRDVKPGNCIRVTRDGDPDFIKLVDFGLAKLVGSGDARRGPQTVAGVVLGTPGYMAPEVEAGLRPDPRVDLYSVGVLMIRLLTGKLPDEGGIRMLGEMLELPPSLLKMLYKALREDPDERFQTAEAMEEALEYIILATARSPSLRSRASARGGTHNRLPSLRPASQPHAAAEPAPAQPAARPVTGRTHERPPAAEEAASQPARPGTGRAHERPRSPGTGPTPAAAPRMAEAELAQPPERRTLALHSGAIQAARIATQRGMAPRRSARGEASPTRSRSRIAAISLLVGLLVGAVLVIWMHMSQGTGTMIVPAPAPAPIVAPAAPVAAAAGPAGAVDSVQAAAPVEVAAPIEGAGTVEGAAPSGAGAEPATKLGKRRRRTVGGEAPASDLKNPFDR